MTMDTDGNPIPNNALGGMPATLPTGHKMPEALAKGMNSVKTTTYEDIEASDEAAAAGHGI